jgi:hypothetical protein
MSHTSTVQDWRLSWRRTSASRIKVIGRNQPNSTTRTDARIHHHQPTLLKTVGAEPLSFRVDQGRDKEVGTVRQMDGPERNLVLIIYVFLPMEYSELALLQFPNGEDRLGADRFAVVFLHKGQVVAVEPPEKILSCDVESSPCGAIEAKALRKGAAAVSSRS